jgi:type VI secretion system protein ImpG
MAVLQMQPEPGESTLVDGFNIPRGSVLRSQIARGEQTACEYRTSHDVQLWPIELTEAEYLAGASAVANCGVPSRPGLKAGLRLRFKTTLPDLKFNQIALASLESQKSGKDVLPIFLRGAEELPFRLYEQLLGNTMAVAVRPVTAGSNPWVELIETQPIHRLGFGDEEALLPVGERSFQGYRLLHEYFAFPQRFLFFQLAGLAQAFRRCGGAELEVVVLFNKLQSQLNRSIDASNFGLFCAPAINLFPRRADRIHIDQQNFEYHIVPDRTRPMDFEVHSVSEVAGFGGEPGEEQPFLPFYGFENVHHLQDQSAYYTLRRRKRLSSPKPRSQGNRSSYLGNEVYVALVDSRQAPFRSDLKQLGLQVFCTNRDLPLLMPVGVGTTDFTLQAGAPVRSIRCLAGPTKPRPSTAEGENAWRLVNHLSLNYLSLADTDHIKGAATLRELLSLYADFNDPAARKQIDGVLSVAAKNIVRRIDAVGPIVFGRGLEVAVRFDESAFEGSGIFLCGAVLEQFFARYASLNTFTETAVVSNDRGEIMRWPSKPGQRQIF